MVQAPFTNIQSKIKIIHILCHSFTPIQGFHQGSLLSMYYALLRLRYLQFSLMLIHRIKGIHTVDHEIKTVDFADYDTTIF